MADRPVNWLAPDSGCEFAGGRNGTHVGTPGAARGSPHFARWNLPGTEVLAQRFGGSWWRRGPQLAPARQFRRMNAASNSEHPIEDRCAAIGCRHGGCWMPMACAHRAGRGVGTAKPVGLQYQAAIVMALWRRRSRRERCFRGWAAAEGSGLQDNCRLGRLRGRFRPREHLAPPHCDTGRKARCGVRRNYPALYGRGWFGHSAGSGAQGVVQSGPARGV